MQHIYSTLRWRAARARAIERDAGRCTVSRLIGGTCSGGSLHVHHIVPVRAGGARYDLDNLGTACATHHPKWEALRRRLVADEQPRQPRCPHYHRDAEARALCEARMARRVREQDMQPQLELGFTNAALTR